MFRISFIDYRIFNCNVDLMNNNYKLFVIFQYKKNVKFFKSFL